MTKNIRRQIQSFLTCCLSVCLALSAATTRAQDKTVSVVTLKNATVSLSANAAAWLDSFRQSKPATPAQVLVQFRSLPAQQERAVLNTQGISLMDYVGNRSFIALIQPAADRSKTDITNIYAIAAVQPSWKMDAAVQQMTAGAKGNTTVLVSAYAVADMKSFREHIAAVKGIITGKNYERAHAYIVTLPVSQLNKLAAWYAVKYIGVAPDVAPLNFESRNATRANLGLLPVSLGGYGLTGEGVTAGVGDNVSGMYHADLKDRILNFNPGPYTNHGQHTNGTVGGAGIIDPKGEGFAPHVRLIDHVYDLVLIETAAMFQAYNMTLTNNSYAAVVGNCAYAGTYDVLSQYLDDVAKQNPYTLHVFASGNDGGMLCAPYNNGLGTVCGGYQPAKNIVVVGNMNKVLNLAAGSSKGPVKDGRIKPEICAIGQSVYSTKGVDAYLSASGTSMACPNVTGALALLTERYKQLHSGANPQADLLKCLLVNGAADMGVAGPDYRYGFGLMHLGRSLQMHDNNRYTINTVSNSGQQTFTITVPANTAQLKVMLYWSDTSASPLATNALVNDLDLELTEPSSVLHHPLVLDPTPANADNPATEGIDHKNNIEQVVVNNPAAGTYTVTVKGYSVITAAQRYVVAYDFLPQGMSFTYPVAGAAYPANDSLRVFWDASAGTNTFTLEFSTDNGTNWNTVAANIPAAQRTYSFYTPNINAAQCRFRLTRNTTGQQITGEPFVIHTQSVITADTAQCPGYMAMHWDAVPNATAYEVLLKKGAYLQPVDTVSATSFVFSGLSPDTTYYATIRPFINNTPGWRSIAIIRQPNTGNCTGSYSDGDLMVQRIETPRSGRRLTSTQLGAAEPVSVRIRNLDNAAAANYKLSYRLNNGAWQSQTFTTPVPANGTAVVTLGTVDLSAVGNYTITAAVQNLAITDPEHRNDTAVLYVRQLANNPVNLNAGFTEDFETAANAVTVMKDSMGVLANDHWDFANSTDSGRLRFSTSNEIDITGNRSASLDAYMYVPASNINYLDGSFNLAAYDTATDEVRLEFDYKLHGRPKFLNGNQVWVRGSDTRPWLPLVYYDTTKNQGQIVNSGSLSLTSLLAQNGQDFTSSFQVRFGQNDTSVIAANDYGNGLTLDNIKLYTVKNDVELLSVVSPEATGCSYGNAVPLTIQIHNNYNQPQNNVQLYYRVDGGAVVHESITTISAKDTIDYTFSATMNLSAPGAHTISTWLVAAGDTYQYNDSINNYPVRNQPLITQYPYLENFESGDGSWYTAGNASSWAYGTPASLRITRAASGTKAWKTNLTGYYNNSEKSYLYSPCFDLSGLTNPMLSFSTAMDIEHCDNVCDAAYIEYTTNDSVWTMLGAKGQGTNWYDTSGVWNTQDNTRWHVASIPLPKLSLPVRFRFVMNSDAGTTREGVAVDDIHIFDRLYSAYDGNDAGPVMQSAGGNQWINFLQNGRLMAQLQPGNQNLGNTGVSTYVHAQMYDRQSSQYFLPRNFVVQPATQPADSVTTRLFITDNDVLAMINATGCNECAAATDAYTLGITKYHDPEKDAENGFLADNVNGSYSYYPAGKIKWVPYDNGYYAEVKLPSFSELWFNNGAPAGTNVLTVAPVDLTAQKISETNALADWTSHVDTFVHHYELQRSPDSNQFSTIYTVNALHQLSNAHYSYTDTPNLAQGAAVYYRVKYTLNNGGDFYTYLRRVDWLPGNQVIHIYPNPVTNHELYITWTAENNGDHMDALLTDMLGRKISSYIVPASGWTNTSTLQIPPVGAGVYFIRISIGNNHFVQKLLIR